VKQIILGTAGHIDHGKTSLIKAVTGINTDRLKEEQARGITIELGFASMVLPSGQPLGIVDVPGHEKFVKTMVAGATVIDMVAMVIAADEGVMPQTREHMEICTLLGIRHGVVVLTKVDLVDEEWLALVTDDVENFTAGTFLADAPVIPVSSATGEGLEAFTAALDELSIQVPAHSDSGLFRLPIDRVFTMKGFGTVITGTIVSGKMGVGESVMIYPTGAVSKVRGIQVHNRSVEQAEAGRRTAINFQGLEKTAIERGGVVARPGTLVSSYMIDVELTFLESNQKPLKSRTRIRFHTGTSEVMGKVVVLGLEQVLPGDTVAAQLRLETPVGLVKDDRFVLRSYSPVRTIGGGRILNPIASKHKRLTPEAVGEIAHLAQQEPAEVIAYHGRESRYRGVSLTELLVMTNLTEKRLDRGLQALLSNRALVCTDKENRRYHHRDILGTLQAFMTEGLQDYHEANPLKPGMAKEELRSKMPQPVTDKLFHISLNELVRNKTVVVEGEMIRNASHQVRLGADQVDAREKILTTYRKSGLTPPYVKDVVKSLGLAADQVKDVLMLLVGDGQLAKVKEELYFCARAVHELEERLVEFLEAHEEIGMPQFKELTRISRKYSVPLMEYFDSQHVTLRIGDIRKLRKKRT